MAKTLTVTAFSTLTGRFASTGDLETANTRLAWAQKTAFTNGTGANQAEVYVSYTETLIKNTRTHDLAGASATLVDMFGAAFNIQLLKYLAIVNLNTGTGELLQVYGTWLSTILVTPGDARVIVPAGGILVWSSPVDGGTVADGTSDQLTLNAVSNDVGYELRMIGVST